MKMTHASRLTDSELVAAVGRLARGEREATVALIVHLAEFDARRLYEAEGYSSTFSYCQKALRLSEDAAFNRIEAARLARRYPVVVDMLTSGALNPTTARLLHRHLTDENHRELLEAASGKSKQDVERLLAVRFPQPDVPARVRPLGVAAPSTQVAQSAVPAVVPPIDASTAHPVAEPNRVPAPDVQTSVLSHQRYEIRFTATAETHEKLRLAQDLLAHAVPSGDLAQVFDRALSALVAELTRRKTAATSRPRPGRSGVSSKHSRYAPAEVRRLVWRRDEGRCAFVALSGQRCGERRFVEFHHHVLPHGRGGQPTADNLQLRCRAHNGYEAERVYGKEKRYRREVTRSGTGGRSDARSIWTLGASSVSSASSPASRGREDIRTDRRGS